MLLNFRIFLAIFDVPLGQMRVNYYIKGASMTKKIF